MDSAALGSTILPAVFRSAIAADPERKLFTYYDGRSGEHTEVSASTLGDWAARTAALVLDPARGPASRVAVLLPPHWQTAAVLLGAWSAGAIVAYHSPATDSLRRPGDSRPFDVLFAALDRVPLAPPAHRKYAFALAPNAARVTELPAGYQDYVTAINAVAVPGPAAYPDIRPSDPAVSDGTTYEEWASVTTAMAESQGLGAGDRVLVAAERAEHPLKWLLAPLAAGASIVLCANVDDEAERHIAESEGVTTIL